MTRPYDLKNEVPIRNYISLYYYKRRNMMKKEENNKEDIYDENNVDGIELEDINPF